MEEERKRKDVLSRVCLSSSLSIPFFHFSVSLMKPLNTSSKRISFLGRSHFHLEKENSPYLGLSRFFARLKGIVPTNRVYRCRFKSCPGKIALSQSAARKLRCKFGCTKKNNQGSGMGAAKYPLPIRSPV